MKKLFSFVLVMMLITSITALVGCNGLWGFDEDDDTVAGPLTFSIPASIVVANIDAPVRPAVIAGNTADYSSLEAMVYLRGTNLVDTFIASFPINADGTFNLSFQGAPGEYYVKIASNTILLYKYFGQLNSANAATTTTQILDEESTALGMIVQGAITLGDFINLTSVTTAEIQAVEARVAAALLAGTNYAKLVVDVNLNKSATSIVVGQNETLTAEVSPADATDGTVTWASSNTGVATVSNAGVVTAVAVGTANITVTTTDGSLVATCAVTVTPIRVASVSVAPTTLSLLTGATGNLTATVLPANAADKTYAWSSSNTAVATVSNAGVVTAVAPGTANIIVTTTDGGLTAACAVTVTAAPVAATGVSVNPTTLTLTAGGATGTITATVAPANATNKNINWSTSAAGVATVAGGVVTPVAAGNAVITATTADGGFIATCQVTVNAAPAEDKTVVTFNNTVTGLNIADIKVVITAGTSATFNATTFTTSTVVVAGSNRDLVKEATESNATQVVLMFNGIAFDTITDFNSLTFTTAIPGGCVVKIMNPAGDTLATSNNL